MKCKYFFKDVDGTDKRLSGSVKICDSCGKKYCTAKNRRKCEYCGKVTLRTAREDEVGNYET